MNSTVGRPRSLTDAQVAAILEWHRNRKSFKQFARELGVSQSTIQNCIRSCGRYKQASPELRRIAIRLRQGKFERLVEQALA
jgi:transposase